MLNPGPSQLLTGVADALGATVMDELAPGPAREQLQAAIGILRRVARALPQLGPYLQADSRDLAMTLRQLAQHTDEGVPPDGEVAEALAVTDALGSVTWPTLDELVAVNLCLRQAVADLAAGAGSVAGPSDAALRALLGRMTEREVDLRLSPWER